MVTDWLVKGAVATVHKVYEVAETNNAHLITPWLHMSCIGLELLYCIRYCTVGSALLASALL